jgi:hypothetical protein
MKCIIFGLIMLLLVVGVIQTLAPIEKVSYNMTMVEVLK